MKKILFVLGGLFIVYIALSNATSLKKTVSFNHFNTDKQPQWVSKIAAYHFSRCEQFLDVEDNPIEDHIKDSYSNYEIDFAGIDIYNSDIGKVYAFKELHHTQQYGLLNTNYIRYWFYDQKGNLIKYTAPIHSSPLALERLTNNFGSLDEVIESLVIHNDSLNTISFKESLCGS